MIRCIDHALPSLDSRHERDSFLSVYLCVFVLELAESIGATGFCLYLEFISAEPMQLCFGVARSIALVLKKYAMHLHLGL